MPGTGGAAMSRHTWMDARARGIGSPLKRNIHQVNHTDKCVTAHDDE